METLVIFLGLMIALFVLGVPVAVAIGLTCLAVLALDGGLQAIPTELFALQMLRGINAFPILAIPFFILAAMLMNVGSATNRIFDFANALVGHIRGGLGHVNVVASMIFAGMSGTAAADAAGLGQLEIKAMNQRGYPLWFSTGITGASSVIGPIIPPSVAMVVYGWLSGASISALFIAALVPGVLLGLALMATVLVYSYRIDLPVAPRPSAGELGRLFARAFLPLLTPVIIVGGIWSGVFTPTESGAIASIYALILGTVIYREVGFREIVDVLRSTVQFTAIILFIIAIATFYGWLLVRLQIPQNLALMLADLNLSKTALLFAIMGFFVIVGCFMSVVEAVMIFTPIFMVAIRALGIDPVYFGVLMVVTLSVGVITPPFGNVLYILVGITKLPYEAVVRAMLPFLVPIFLVIALLIVVPDLVTFLPNHFR
ncbi:MAG: TRAP transporter large permease [Geminicoccaceae bacterium]|nr:MAG: TRAP transporter large permease [Geminicoccaceae bacterium]